MHNRANVWVASWLALSLPGALAACSDDARETRPEAPATTSVAAEEAPPSLPTEPVAPTGERPRVHLSQCGCGCCGGIEHEPICVSDEALDRIIEEDARAVPRAEDCFNVGCSRGVLYRACEPLRLADLPATARGSCTFDERFECLEPKGDDPIALLRRECRELRGLWSRGACTATDRVGACVTPSSTTHYYSGAPEGRPELCVGRWAAP